MPSSKLPSSRPRAHTRLPLGADFGIGTPEAAASAVVKRLEEFAAGPDKIPIELPKFLAQWRAALDPSTAAPDSAGGAHA